MVILSIGILVISGLYVDVLNRLQEQRIELGRLRGELESLKEGYDRLAGLPELVNLSIRNPVTHLYGSRLYIVSGYCLNYWHLLSDSRIDRSIHGFYTVFYAPLDNLTLKMYLFVYPTGVVQVPLTLQIGNALRGESGIMVEKRLNYTVWQSPVIWSVNATENRAYEVTLPTRGWYTLSMTGPIQRTSSGAVKYWCFIGKRFVNGTWQWIEHVQAWVDFQLLKNGKPILFAVLRRYE